MNGLTIFVLPRGWVVVGMCDGSEDLLGLKLTKSGVVRRWGTEKGLGELAEKGPRPDTIIDRSPDGSTVNLLHVYQTIKCDETAKAWKEWLK